MTKDSNITYFLTRSLFLGFGLSLLFDEIGKDYYIGAFIGIFIGLIFTYLYSYILKKKGSKSLKEIFKNNKIVGFITRTLLLLASIFILVYILVVYKIFVVSFLLVNSPELFISIPFIILATYCAFKGLKVIKRFASSLLPISIVLNIIILCSLLGFIETTNFLPIMSAKTGSIFKTALFYAGISSFPNILSLHFNSPKGINKMYIIASISLVLVALTVEGVLGEVLVKVFRFPEYIVLKQIKLFQFIEKVENILSIIWIFDLFMTAIMCIYSIKELVPEYKNKYSTIGILIILIYIIDNYLAFNYVNELKVYYLMPYISLIVPIIIIIPLLYLTRKKTN